MHVITDRCLRGNDEGFCARMDILFPDNPYGIHSLLNHRNQTFLHQASEYSLIFFTLISYTNGK